MNIIDADICILFVIKIVEIFQLQKIDKKFREYAWRHIRHYNKSLMFEFVFFILNENNYHSVYYINQS